MKKILLGGYLLTSFSLAYAIPDTNVIEVFKKVPEKRIYQPQYLLKEQLLKLGSMSYESNI